MAERGRGVWNAVHVRIRVGRGESPVSTKVSSEKTYRVADHLRSAKFHEPPGSLVEVEHGHGVRQGAEIHLRQAAATDSELDGAVKIRHGGEDARRGGEDSVLNPNEFMKSLHNPISCQFLAGGHGGEAISSRKLQ